MEMLMLFFVNYFKWTGDLKSQEPKTPKGCLCVIRYKGHKDLKNKLLKDMVLVCFNVSVYLMDTTTKKMEGSMSNETISSSIDEKSYNLLDSVERKDTSLFEEISMVNPTNTYEPNEDTKMMESSVDEKIIEKDYWFSFSKY